MELLAVIHGLNKIEEADTVRVNTDSMYVKNGITSWIKKWVENGWKTAAKKDVANKDLWVKLQSIVEAGSDMELGSRAFRRCRERKSGFLS